MYQTLEASSTSEGFEMRSLPSGRRPPSRYDVTYAMLDKYDIEVALQTLDTANQRNAEPLLHPWESEHITLVHFAAYRGNLRILKRAAALQIPMYDTDVYGRCALHYAADRGHIDVVNWLLEYSSADCGSSGKGNYAHPQLSLPDYRGRTPLHDAVELKYVGVVKILVEAGADVNFRDKQGIPPFLLAHCHVTRDNPVMRSQYEQIVDILARGKACVTFFHPLTGWSALHYAVTLNSWRAADRLIESGAQPNSCRMGRITTTPVHLAARFGYHKTLCILLKALPSKWIDTPNEHGWSPLHLVAVLGNLKCVRTLVDNGANLAGKNPHGNTVIDLLSMFRHEADLLTFFTDMLDAKIRFLDLSKDSSQIAYDIVVDFQSLTPKGQSQMTVTLALIKTLPRIEQLTILQHPVLQIFLKEKWSRVRYVFYSFVAVHVIHVPVLSCYAIVLLKKYDCAIPRRLLIFSSCPLFCHILLQFVTKPKRYCKEFVKWLSLICVTTSIIVALEDEITHILGRTFVSKEWVLGVIGIAILLAWIRIMLLAGQFPAWGFYALIFSTVFKNVLKVLFIGVWLIIGFTFSFVLLFNGKKQFDNPLKAFVKTVVMMTGEYDYDDLFTSSRNDTISYNMYQEDPLLIISNIIFLGFVLLASIVLMNLMIGLAVSDIQGLVKEGQLSRLLKQVKFIADCERMATVRIFKKNLVPNCIGKILKSTIGREKNISWHWSHQKDQNISDKMWKDLFKLSMNNRNLNKTFVATSCTLGNVNDTDYCDPLDDELEDLYAYIH